MIHSKSLSIQYSILLKKKDPLICDRLFLTREYAKASNKLWQLEIKIHSIGWSVGC